MSEMEMAIEGGTLTDLVRELLVEDEGSLTAYIEQSWVTRAIEALHDARRRTSLTQEEVAKRLGTTQSAIARLENNHEGSISLRRYVHYALACGMVPFDMTLEPVSAMRQYIMHDPDAARTPLAYYTWSVTNARNMLTTANAQPSTSSVALAAPSLPTNARDGQHIPPQQQAPVPTLNRSFEPARPHVDRRQTVADRRQETTDTNRLALAAPA